MIDISGLYGRSLLPAAGGAAKKGNPVKEQTFLQLMEQAGLGDPEGETGSGVEGVVDQLADPESQFYQDMFQRIRVQLEQSEEEKKKQAIIDTLDAILEGMRSIDGGGRRKDMVSSVAGLSRQISELDADDPRRAQLDLFRQRLNQLGIFVDLDLGVKDDREDGWKTLTEYLIDEENKDFDPGIFDLI